MLWQKADAVTHINHYLLKKMYLALSMTISSEISLLKFVQRKIIKEEEGTDGGQNNHVLINNVLQNYFTEFIYHLLLPKGGIYFTQSRISLYSDSEFTHSANMYQSLLQSGPITDAENTKINKALAYLQSTYILQSIKINGNEREKKTKM